MKILVVDDEVLNLRIVKDLIEKINPKIEVYITNNPEEAYDIIVQKEIDIVFLDIMMPKKSGIEVLSDIRANSNLNHTQVIMLTALVDREVFKGCFELGANDYILKPIEFTEFTSRLKGAMLARENYLKLNEVLTKLKAQYKEVERLNSTIRENQFQMAQKEKMASIGELAAGVAHEINNPMGFISSNIETLGIFFEKIKEVYEIHDTFFEFIETLYSQDLILISELERVKEEQKKRKLAYVMKELEKIIEDSLKGVERVTKIVTSLKSFARTGFEDEIKPNDINEVLEEVLMIVKNEAKYVCEIVKDFEDVPLVTFEKGQIGQVAMNIIINGIHAIKEKKESEESIVGIIKIRTYSEDERYVCVSIEDDGPGIPDEIKSRILEPFFTTKEVGKGTGLGLSISYDIVTKKHRGILAIKDSELGGARFEIKLPLRREDDEEDFMRR